MIKSDDKEIGNEKVIKRLKKTFKGMKERIKNPKSNFNQVSELFKDSVYQAFIINDYDLSYRALVAHKEIVEILESRLRSCKRDNEKYQISKFLFECEAIMSKIMYQSGRFFE